MRGDAGVDADHDDDEGDAPGVTPAAPLSTAGGGKPAAAVDTSTVSTPTDRTNRTERTTEPASEQDEVSAQPEAPADLARSALAAAQVLARRRPGRAGRERNRRDNLAGRRDGRDGGPRRGGYSAPGPDPARDPQPVGSLLDGLVADQGWERPLADARVFADWGQLVGPDVAAHATPQSLRDGELRIAAESTAWATQLRLLSATVLARLVAELGPDVVTRLVVTGPVAPSWRHGARSVRGHRGPRDTYG